MDCHRLLTMWLLELLELSSSCVIFLKFCFYDCAKLDMGSIKVEITILLSMVVVCCWKPHRLFYFKIQVFTDQVAMRFKMVVCSELIQFKEFFELSIFLRSLNATFLVLVVKKGSVEDLKDFKLISLLGGYSRLLTKVLVNKLNRVVGKVF